MEGVVDGGNGGGPVVMELSHIKDLVKQLEGHLGGSQTHTQELLCKNLAKQISSRTERSISLITSYYLDAGRKRSAADASPLSGASDAPFKTTKKRKTMGKVKNQVRVSSACGGDIPADDGHSWRKYGQKEILGAKYPRSYYRCTHRHSQGCLATKQVQRTDEDPTLFDVIYIGTHTCVQTAAAAAATAAPPPEDNPGAQSFLQSLSSNLTVKTEGLAVAPEERLQGWAASAAAPFCGLSSTPASGGCLQAPELISPFSAPSTTSENWGVSPATSESNQQPGVSFPPFEFEVVAGDLTFEFGEVVSARVDVTIPDDDFDISSFFA